MQFPAKWSPCLDSDPVSGCSSFRHMSTAESLEIEQYLQPSLDLNTKLQKAESYQQIFADEPYTSVTLTDKATLSLRRQNKSYYKSRNSSDSFDREIAETVLS